MSQVNEMNINSVLVVNNLITKFSGIKVLAIQKTDDKKTAAEKVTSSANYVTLSVTLNG